MERPTYVRQRHLDLHQHLLMAVAILAIAFDGIEPVASRRRDRMLARLFLFALLVCDWAGDPEFGQSLLSPDLGSQEVYCHSFSWRNEVIRVTCRRTLLTAFQDGANPWSIPFAESCDSRLQASVTIAPEAIGHLLMVRLC